MLFQELNLLFLKMFFNFFLVKNEKDYRLEDVIEHMTLLPDYFQKKTLFYEMEIEDPLYLNYLDNFFGSK